MSDNFTGSSPKRGVKVIGADWSSLPFLPTIGRDDHHCIRKSKPLTHQHIPSSEPKPPSSLPFQGSKISDHPPPRTATITTTPSRSQNIPMDAYAAYQRNPGAPAAKHNGLPPRPQKQSSLGPPVFSSNEFQRTVDGASYPDNMVFINVYHLLPQIAILNDLGAKMNLGVYHCSVEIFGREWMFGQNDPGIVGIYCEPARSSREYKFCESVVVGELEQGVDLSAIKTMIRSLEPAWMGSDYDLLAKNCIHFVDAFLKVLGFDTTRVPSRLTNMMKISEGARNEYYQKGLDKKMSRGIEKFGRVLSKVAEGIAEESEKHQARNRGYEETKRSPHQHGSIS